MTWDRYVDMRADLSVSFPRNFVLRAIAGDAAYGVDEDELGVQYIKRYGLGRTR